MNGELEEEECDFIEVHNFSKLLASNRNQVITNNNEEISLSESFCVVTKAKKCISLFFNKVYTACKCTLECKEITNI